MTLPISSRHLALLTVWITFEFHLNVHNLHLELMENLSAVQPRDAAHLLVTQAAGVDVGHLGVDVVEDVRRGLVQLVGLVLEDPLVGQRVESV